jgi:hypothetical protein
MRFGERELTSFAQPVSEDSLNEGQVYFSVQYMEDGLLTPTIKPLVFVGKYVSPDGLSRFRFQDISSYRRGIRYDSAAAGEANFESAREGGVNHIFEYERALDELMRCALRRRKVSMGE